VVRGVVGVLVDRDDGERPVTLRVFNVPVKVPLSCLLKVPSVIAIVASFSRV
jgi:hypothetical protein